MLITLMVLIKDSKRGKSGEIKRLYMIRYIVGMEDSDPMPEWPPLALAQEIIQWFMNDEFKVVIIYGEQRMGKSVYALKVMGQVLNYLKGLPLSNELVDRFMGWRPIEVVDQLLSIEGKIPVYTWDDAGYWLWALDWNDPVLKAFMKYLNVIGTDMACLILTTPDPRWILKKITAQPSARTIKIIKASGNSRWRRIAKGYQPYVLPDLTTTRVKSWLEDTFSCKCRQDVYDYYRPKRLGYALEAKQLLRKTVMGVRDLDKEMGPVKRDLDYLTDRAIVEG